MPGRYSALGQSRQNSIRAYQVCFRTYCDRRAPLVGHVELHRQAVIQAPVPRSCTASSPFWTGKDRGENRRVGAVSPRRTVHRSERSSHRPDPTGKSLRVIRNGAELCQALPRKIFLFRFSERYDHLPASRCHQEGRRDRHDVGNGERWTRGVCVRRAQVRRGRLKRVVLSPRRWGQVCLAITRAGDGG